MLLGWHSALVKESDPGSSHCPSSLLSGTTEAKKEGGMKRVERVFRKRVRGPWHPGPLSQDYPVISASCRDTPGGWVGRCGRKLGIGGCMADGWHCAVTTAIAYGLSTNQKV